MHLTVCDVEGKKVSQLESGQIVGRGGKRCRDASPRTENDVYSQVTGKKELSKQDLLRDIIKKYLRPSTSPTHTRVTTRIEYGGQVEPEAVPWLNVKRKKIPLNSHPCPQPGGLGYFSAPNPFLGRLRRRMVPKIDQIEELVKEVGT